MSRFYSVNFCRFLSALFVVIGLWLDVVFCAPAGHREPVTSAVSNTQVPFQQISLRPRASDRSFPMWFFHPTPCDCLAVDYTTRQNAGTLIVSLVVYWSLIVFTHGFKRSSTRRKN